jgi:hypothetical protein
MQRLDKSLKERIYLLLANQISLTHWKFNVRGQSNRIYEQNLTSNSYSCSCPDHSTKHTFCKHLLFLLVRVATQMDLAEIICDNKNNWNSVAFDICSSSWIERLKNHINSNNNVDKNAVGSDCSICFEEMKSDEKLVKCITTCKNYFHNSCISMWLSTGHDNCPLCRGKWIKTDTNNELVVNILSKPIQEPIQENNQDDDDDEISDVADIDTDDENFIKNNIVKDLYFVNANEYQRYKVEEDCTIKGFCNKVGIILSKHDIYYEFIKPEVIETSRNLIIINKNTGDIYIGNHTKTLAKTNQSVYYTNSKGERVNKISKPIPDLRYMVFIKSISSHKKLYKDQEIICQSLLRIQNQNQNDNDTIDD